MAVPELERAEAIEIVNDLALEKYSVGSSENNCVIQRSSLYNYLAAVGDSREKRL